MANVQPLTDGDPRRVGDYDVTGRLGEGGQGVVYLGRGYAGQVAIKLLHPQLIEDSQARARFVREVEVTKRVARFCTAQVLSAGLSDGRPYIVSEYVPGPSLHRQLRDEGPRRGSALDRLAINTATALAAIHGAGVVHRDFKPGNVLMGPDGPVVIDFGISRALDASGTMSSAVSQVVGTPAFMAPEQLAEGEIGPHTDMFAWAVTMVYAATGVPAFGHRSIPGVINRILHEEPNLGALDAHLRPIVAACLSKDPESRPTARRLMDALMSHNGSAVSPEATPGAGLSGLAGSGPLAAGGSDVPGAAAFGSGASGGLAGSGSPGGGGSGSAGAGALDAVEGDGPAESGPSPQGGAGAPGAGTPLPGAGLNAPAAYVAGGGSASVAAGDSGGTDTTHPRTAPWFDAPSTPDSPQFSPSTPDSLHPSPSMPDSPHLSPPTPNSPHLSEADTTHLHTGGASAALPPGAGTYSSTGSAYSGAGSAYSSAAGAYSSAGGPSSWPGTGSPGSPEHGTMRLTSDGLPPDGVPGGHGTPGTPGMPDDAGHVDEPPEQRKGRTVLVVGAAAAVAIALIAGIVALVSSNKPGTNQQAAAPPTAPAKRLRHPARHRAPTMANTPTRQAAAAATRSAKKNPYTPQGLCGGGYRVVGAHPVGEARIYLLYNTKAGTNCVVTMVPKSTGRLFLNASLAVRGGDHQSRTVASPFYAGPVRLPARGKCVIWGGAARAAKWTSGWSHCGK